MMMLENYYLLKLELAKYYKDSEMTAFLWKEQEEIVEEVWPPLKNEK